MSPLPVTVLSGFLGSGKTTLLRSFLESAEGARAVVLINEFGEIGLDHLMVKSVVGQTVLLQNGCVCCSVNAELRSGLRDVLTARAKGEMPPFDCIIIETTGLADPAPVVQTLVVDPMLRSQVRLSALVSTVDAMNGLEQIAAQSEAQRQAAIADRIVITKTDLCSARRVSKLKVALARVNPEASVYLAPGAGAPRSLLDAEDPIGSARRSHTGIGAAEPLSPAQKSAPHEGVRSFVVTRERPIDWTPFCAWLSLLVHRHGRAVLRVKGLLSIPGASGPIALNAVQNFIHAPVHLDAWPGEDRRSRVVFIVQGLDEGAIRDSLDSFLERASRVPGAPSAAA